MPESIRPVMCLHQFFEVASNFFISTLLITDFCCLSCKITKLYRMLSNNNNNTTRFRQPRAGRSRILGGGAWRHLLRGAMDVLPLLLPIYDIYCSIVGEHLSHALAWRIKNVELAPPNRCHFIVLRFPPHQIGSR